IVAQPREGMVGLARDLASAHPTQIMQAPMMGMIIGPGVWPRCGRGRRRTRARIPSRTLCSADRPPEGEVGEVSSWFPGSAPILVARLLPRNLFFAHCSVKRERGGASKRALR